MRIGVGLPSTIPGAPASLTLDWARRADAGPFSTLATLDRLVYDSLDSLTTLAAVAAVTTRIRIATNILVSPLYAPAALAKAAASLDALSGGRFTLGVAVGARKEDYDAAGVAYATRGRRLVEQLDSLRDLWEEGRHGPRTENVQQGRNCCSAERAIRPLRASHVTPTATRMEADRHAPSPAPPRKPAPPGRTWDVSARRCSGGRRTSPWARKTPRRAERTCETTTPSPGHTPSVSRRGC